MNGNQRSRKCEAMLRFLTSRSTENAEKSSPPYFRYPRNSLPILDQFPSIGPSSYLPALPRFTPTSFPETSYRLIRNRTTILTPERIITEGGDNFAQLSASKLLIRSDFRASRRRERDSDSDNSNSQRNVKTANKDGMGINSGIVTTAFSRRELVGALKREARRKPRRRCSVTREEGGG